MANNIKGNHDGKNGSNDSYQIPSRGKVTRKTLVKEIEQGKHSNFSTYERDGEKYVRAKPDHTETNNVNEV
jgi:hypothetical protein